MKQIIWNAALAYAGTLGIHARSCRKAHRGLFQTALNLEKQADEIRKAVKDDELANSTPMAPRTRT